MACPVTPGVTDVIGMGLYEFVDPRSQTVNRAARATAAKGMKRQMEVFTGA